MHYSILSIALFACLLNIAHVRADNIPEDNVVVSAHRTPATRSDTGSAVSSIDRQIIEARQTVFITDLLRDLPSLAVSRTGHIGSQTAIRIRGAEANHVLVRIDGIEVNDPSTDGTFAFSHLTANDIGHIEVVRGPQSALWGSDALAGVIDIQTRRSTAPWSADGFFEGGAFDTTNAGMHVGARGAKAGIDVTASHVESDGTNISRSGTEDDGYENRTANLRVDAEVMDNLSLDASLRYVDASKQFDEIDFIATGLPADADRESDNRQTTVGAGARFALFDRAWIQTLRLTQTTNDNDEFADGQWTSAAEAEKTGVYYQSTWHLPTGPTEASAQHVTLAIDYEDEAFKQHGIAAPWGDPNQAQNMHNAGFVGEYRATGFGGLSFSIGIRHDDNSDFDDITTFRSTAAYRIAPWDARLHASLGTGQKSPTFTDRFGFFPDQFRGNPNLKPEKSRAFDIGYEQRFADDRVRTDITYFRRRLTDEIDGFFYDTSLGPFGMFTAANRRGTSNSRGVEVEASADIMPGTRAAASYTYTDAVQPGAAGPAQQETRRPRHMAALNVNTAITDQMQFNINWSYSGTQTDEFFPPFPASSQIVTIGAYTLVDASASIAVTDNVTVFARVENLFDETYENVYGYATAGIGAFIGARIRLAN